MSLRGHLARTAAAAGLAATMGLSLLTSASAADETYYWTWSDGSKKPTRTFTQARYGVQSNLPELVVTADPALPRRTVYLQFYQDGHWTTENAVRTDAKGRAVIDLDPYCSTDTWCDATFRYRLKVGGQTARLTITYAEQ